MLFVLQFFCIMNDIHAFIIIIIIIILKILEYYASQNGELL